MSFESEIDQVVADRLGTAAVPAEQLIGQEDIESLGGRGGGMIRQELDGRRRRDIDVVRELTNRHYAVNHIPPTLDADAFRYTLQARPAVISFALGDPGDLVRQAKEVGRA